MATLDSSIVNIALPTFTKIFSVTLVEVKWVVVVYLFLITCLVLPFGRLSDLFGRRRIYCTGYLIFSIGSGLCALSSTFNTLLFSRAVQGVGAAMLMANGPAVITATFQRGERGKALGVLGMVVSLGLITGPTLGGLLITHVGWTSIFWINIPLGFIGMLLAYRFIVTQAPPAIRPTFDWLGSLLQMLFISTIIWIADSPRFETEKGFQSRPYFRELITLCSVILGSLFFYVEKRAMAPVLDVSLLRIRAFAAGNLASFLSFLAFSSLAVLMPFFLEEILRLPPDNTGLYMSAIPLSVFVVAPFSGRFSDRFGTRGISSIGAGLVTLVLFSFAGLFGSGLTANTSPVLIIFALCCAGISTGLFQSPNNNSIMSAVPIEKLGVASALLATIRNLGLAIGTGLSTALLHWKYHQSADFIKALHFVFAVAGTLSVAAIFASLSRGSHPVLEVKD